MLFAASGVRDLRESRFRARSATRAKFEITLTCGCAHSLDLSSCKVSRADVHRARRSSVSRAGARAYTFVRVFCHEYTYVFLLVFFELLRGLRVHVYCTCTLLYTYSALWGNSRFSKKKMYAYVYMYVYNVVQYVYCTRTGSVRKYESTFEGTVRKYESTFEGTVRVYTI